MVARAVRRMGPTACGRRLALAAVLAAVGATALCGTAVTPVRATWQTVGPAFTEWRWAWGSTGLVGVAVRPDGYLLVVAGGGGIGGDGRLHLVPPWGGPVSAGNAFGPAGLNPLHLAVLDGSVYVTHAQLSASDTPETDVTVLDAATGAYRRTIPWTYGSDTGIAVDPQNHRLLVQGSPAAQHQPGLWELDPASGAATMLVAGEALPPPNLNLAFSPDGSTIFYSDGNELDALSRNGTVQYTVKSAGSQPAVGGIVEQPGGRGCMSGNLYYTSGGPTDTSIALYQVQPPYAANRFSVAAQHASPTGPAAYADLTTDTQGHLVASVSGDVVLVACRGAFTPPAPPPPGSHGLAPPASGPALRAAQPPAGAVAGGGGANVPSGFALPGPRSGVALQPAPATQAQTASAAANAHQAASQASGEAAAQGSVAPNAVGLVDVVDEEPVMGLSATAVQPWSPGGLLPLGLAAVTAMALAAWYSLRRDAPLPSPATGEGPRRP